MYPNGTNSAKSLFPDTVSLFMVKSYSVQTVLNNDESSSYFDLQSADPLVMLDNA